MRALSKVSRLRRPLEPALNARSAAPSNEPREPDQSEAKGAGAGGEVARKRMAQTMADLNSWVRRTLRY
ncbi:MAG: hypothetical protein ACI8RZ_002920, partial [Myxococcota bacterium]